MLHIKTGFTQMVDGELGLHRTIFGKKDGWHIHYAPKIMTVLSINLPQSHTERKKPARAIVLAWLLLLNYGNIWGMIC
jgi:hypothetical protein